MSERNVFVSTLHACDVAVYIGKQARTTSGGSHKPLERAALLEGCRNADALIAVIEDTIDDSFFRACPNIKVVANVAVGFDNIDLTAAANHKVLICNTPGVLDKTTADLAFGLLLAAARRIAEADKYVRARKWQDWTSDLFLGSEVHGKTLGIIGLGRIGQAMARRAKGFDMRVVYTQRNRAAADLEQTLELQYLDLPELLAQADFISIHCPLNAGTRHLIGKAQFAQMKRGCIIINTSRGAVIDQVELIRALQSGTVAGAGLDVFENEPQVPAELIAMDNVVLCPHIGSASVDTRAAMAKLAADGVIAAFSEKLPANAVNPDVWPGCLDRLKSSVSSTR
jgi:glyoxylate reductase